MKKVALILICIISQLSFSQEKKLDPKLFGSWYGTEKDQEQVGVVKNWIMHRFEDGTFILLFTAVENGEVSNFSDSGKCWTEGNIFYEYHNSSKKTDVYTYLVLDEIHVKFKIKSTELDLANKDYEFIDTKLEDNL